jgi:putative ABC transport system permease protein
MLFEPLAQVPDSIAAFDNQIMGLNWVTKTSEHSPTLADQISRETVAVTGGVPMGELARWTSSGRFYRKPALQHDAIGDFCVVALLLAGMGLYGVISYSMAQRTREIGIRSALGVGRRDVLMLVIGQGLKLAFAGLVAGLAAALALTRYLESLLYDVTPTDPFVLASVTGILAGVALLACWLPASRASRIDPLRALREE